ncbi:hypothetical protein [Dyella mobilis]|uniref:TonB C-terminal domain-containing protein n=1 Tax=Dyella mobilis TaxID=1849582 RepID=A0ABS2KE91_9GAMM|nr:hypothetical protein [Dyella mobilis]MBM7129506.1 hypothetical protein [Dyella mobilis]GLQ98229.1 hypothetical protein GCM10007863_26490 [Dyella mobilis]
MKALLLAMLGLASASTTAKDSFDQRVSTASKLEETPQGQAYDKVLYGAIGNDVQKAMVLCFPKGTKADTGRFTLVATLLSNGSASDIEVRPATKMAKCFAAKFAAAPFPALPAYASEDGLPIFMDMQITP